MIRVELTAGFLARLDEIEAFLTENDAAVAFDELLVTLRSVVIPNLRQFPRMGRRYLECAPRSAEALALLKELGADADALREYVLPQYLILYVERADVVYLLSIRHHRQLSFDFGRVWRE